jgi:CRP-like cAMP-binding protein
VEERCARWILTTHDRIAVDELALTHELLAATLGVRRAGVTLAVRGLQEAGLVRSGRGTIAILDRSRLEGVSCECYQTLRDCYARLMPTPA